MSQQKLSYSLLNQTYQLQEPFLWVHIALLAAVPLTMILCMMGLAVGDPLLPGWLEMIVLGLPAIALPIWLQWTKPLSPFSLWVVNKPSDRLSEDRRRLLSVLKSPITPWIAIVAGVFLYVVFRQLYIYAPLASDIAVFPPVLRLLGIGWALVFLLISSFLWQSGVSAIHLLLTRDLELSNINPYPIEQIKADFLNLGKRSPQLLELEYSPTITPDGFEKVKAELVVTPQPPQLALEKQVEPPAELLEEFGEQLSKSVIPNENITSEDEEEFLRGGESKEEAQSEIAETTSLEASTSQLESLGSISTEPTQTEQPQISEELSSSESPIEVPEQAVDRDPDPADFNSDL